jgi:hypothetical protein
MRTGTATSDENGRYRLDFGSAIHSNDLDMIQAATISVSYPGYFETNLGRQGDLIAAWKQPATLEWGDRNEEHLVLPGKTKVVNFRLAPATRLVGRIVQGENQAPAAGFRVELTGDVLPPSSSVFDVVEADGNGQFEFPNVPTGYSFQVLIFRPGHENEAAFASPPLAFRGNTSTEDTEADPTATDHTAVAFRDGARDIRCEFKSIQFILNGSGESWRNAISSARDQPLRFNETVSIEGNLFRSDEVTAVLGKRD